MNKTTWKLIQIKQVTKKTNEINPPHTTSVQTPDLRMKYNKTRAKFTKQVIQQAKQAINDEDLTIINSKT